MSEMLGTRVFLLEWSTPQTHHLLLHHSISSFIGSCSSQLRVTFLMKVSFCLATWFWIFGIYKKASTNFLHFLFSLLSLVSLWSQLLSWCSNVGKIPVYSVVRRVGTRSRIPIVEDLWGWKGRSSICFGVQRMCTSKSDSILPLMRRRR